LLLDYARCLIPNVRRTPPGCIDTCTGGIIEEENSIIL
jgi:hypothetical protein